MPLLDDARALLDIDRERIRILREAHDVNRATLDTAKELAQLGEVERPKNEAFIRSMREGAGFLPAGEGSASSRAALPSRSSGGGGGGGEGGSGGSRPGSILRSRGNAFSRTEDWIGAHCSRTTAEIPRPGNPGAAASGDFVTVDAWDCNEALGLPAGSEEGIFLDPASVQAYLGPRRSSSSSGGGSGGGGGRTFPGGAVRDDPSRVPKDNPSLVPSSSGVSSSTAPSADGKLLERTLRDGVREIVRELRAGADLGLQIRRNGGL